MEQPQGLAVQQVVTAGSDANITYTVMDPGWRSADEAPKALFSLGYTSHTRRSKPIWLLQGPYTYRQPNRQEPWEDDGPEKTDPPQIVLGYCVWPLVRFIGKRQGPSRTGSASAGDYAEGKEYEQWLPTREHYFVSLEHDADQIFPAQYWREIDSPPMPLDVPRDDDFRWGTRYIGFDSRTEVEVGAPSQYLKNLRRAYTEEPYTGE